MPETIEEMCKVLQARGRPALIRGAIAAAQAAGVDDNYMPLLGDVAKLPAGDQGAFRATIRAWCKQHGGEDLIRELDGFGKGKDRSPGLWDRIQDRNPTTREIFERPAKSTKELALEFLRAAKIERNSDTAKGFLYALLAITESSPRACRKYTQEAANAAFRTAVATDRKSADIVIQRILGLLQAAAVD